jgi:FkbM family methyltransferase
MDFKLEGKQAELYTTFYGRFLLYFNDTITDTVRAGKFWEDELMPVFDNNLNKESVVIEVGSFMGDHTVYLSKLCKKVYAFEPQRHIYHQLCANLFLNKCTNVDAKELLMYDGKKLRLATVDRGDRYAIPTSTEILTNALEYENTDNPSGIFFKPDDNGNLTTHRLDDVIVLDEHIDMIIVDAEGSDLPILSGAMEIIKKHKPIIVYEFNLAGADIHGNTITDYENFFRDLNYSTEQIGHWNWVGRPNV